MRLLVACVMLAFLMTPIGATPDVSVLEARAPQMGDETVTIAGRCYLAVASVGAVPEYWEETNAHEGLQRQPFSAGGRDFPADRHLTLPEWTVDCVLANAGTCCASGDALAEGLLLQPADITTVASGTDAGEETLAIHGKCYLYVQGTSVTYWKEDNQYGGLQTSSFTVGSRTFPPDLWLTLPNWSIDCVLAEAN